MQTSFYSDHKHGVCHDNSWCFCSMSKVHCVLPIIHVLLFAVEVRVVYLHARVYMVSAIILQLHDVHGELQKHVGLFRTLIMVIKSK